MEPDRTSGVWVTNRSWGLRDKNTEAKVRSVCARLHLKQRLEKGWSVSSTAAVCLPMKLQYFGHLMRRVDSLEKTLMLGGIGAPPLSSPLAGCPGGACGEGSASLFWRHGRGIGHQETLKKDSPSLSRVTSGNSGFPRLVPVTSGSFSLCL